MRNVKLVVSASVLTLASAGCGQGFKTTELNSVGGEISSGVTCPQAREKIFESYHRAYSEQMDVSEKSFGDSVRDYVTQKSASGTLDSTKQLAAIQSIGTVHTVLARGLSGLKAKSAQMKIASSEEQEFVPENEEDDLLHLARLEMRSEIEPEYSAINAELDLAISNAAVAAAELGISCENPAGSPVSDNPALPGDTEQNENIVSKASKNHPLYGALYTMAASYQSCSVLDLAPVVTSTAPAQGFARGAKIDSVGYGRVYTDVGLLKRTHYYHRGQSYGPGCADQSAQPLIYDYGGVPAVGSNVLNLFKNAGGGSALGVDCSAYISAAAAVSGNLYKPSTSRSPVYRRFVSRDFINPSKSGWTCYSSAAMTSKASIQTGDIAAIKGHVVYVDKIGTDPFGLTKIKSSSGCSSISVRNFDFIVIQSSPDKGSLGINRFEARDYLAGGGAMATMFLGYAKAACFAKFDGTARTAVTESYGIIRHKQTETCLAKRMPLTNESCVASCSAWNDFE